MNEGQAFQRSHALLVEGQAYRPAMCLHTPAINHWKRQETA
jgi:hypothetical protein